MKENLNLFPYCFQPLQFSNIYTNLMLAKQYIKKNVQQNCISLRGLSIKKKIKFIMSQIYYPRFPLHWACHPTLFWLYSRECKWWPISSSMETCHDWRDVCPSAHLCLGPHSPPTKQNCRRLLLDFHNGSLSNVKVDTLKANLVSTCYT
jgi:hypothetical protein